ncbi:MAG: hypothetical protein NC452_02380 [Eubacterium sp.]|nr:hypothetical protein [Eubacterium sp.]
MKKILVYFIVVIITVINTLNISVSAKNLTSNDLIKMSDYDYYCTLAKAFKNGDSYIISLFIDCCSTYHGTKIVDNYEMRKTCEDANCKAYEQFDYIKKIKISDYKVEVLRTRNADDKYFVRNSAKITFTIDKSNNAFFPEGTHSYRVNVNPYNSGMFGDYLFKPYDEKSKKVAEKYNNIIITSELLSMNLNQYKSASENELKNTKYSKNLIHDLFHTAFLNDENGYSEAELNSLLQNFFNSKNTIAKDVLKTLPKHDDRYFKRCGHGNVSPLAECKKITKNKKSGLYTFDIWFYSDAAKLNVCRKIKFTYKISDGKYTIKKINCYYSNDYDVKVLGDVG